MQVHLPMARRKRGRKKKFKINFNVRPETIRSTISMLFILFAGIILISFVASGYTLNAKIQLLIRTGFGYAFFLLIPILLITGLIFTNAFKWRILEMRIVSGLVVLLFSLSGVFHLFVAGDNAYEYARKGMGGGMVGYQISTLLANNISIAGAIFVLTILTMLGMLWTMDKGHEELFAMIRVLGMKTGIIRDKEEKAEGQGDKSFDKVPYSAAFSEEHSHEEPEPAMVGEHASKEPQFEFIPPMSEPQDGHYSGSSYDSASSIASITPHLPYTDRVWELPPLELLSDPSNVSIDRGNVNERARIIISTLESFGIKAHIEDIRYGPSVTQYALSSEQGTKIAKIVNLQYDLALQLASPTGSVRIEAPIPGEKFIGIEVPNNTRVPVNFKELLTSEQMKASKSKLSIVLGKNVKGEPRVYNFSKMPHLLIAGATNSGKSVFIHNIMASILFRASPQEVKFILIDPKRVELVHYNGIPHLLSPVVVDIDKAASAFKWLVQEMERRYKLLETAKVRNIDAYNEKSGFQAMPYIVLIVDELAEIMVTDPASVEKSIVRLAQLARATGIHLVLTLQRPSTNVITGLIKANIPCRIAFGVTSQVDSRVIIDQPGAEKLLGQGDMLFVPPDESKPVRIQGAWVSDKEISNLVTFLKNSGFEPDYKAEIFEVQETDRSVAAGGDGVDALFDEAAELVVAEGKGSASLLQRRLAVGYSRAARILDELEAHGIVGPAKGSKPRDILVKNPPSHIEPEDSLY